MCVCMCVCISCRLSDSSMADPVRSSSIDPTYSSECPAMHANNSPSAVFPALLVPTRDHEIMPSSRWHGEHYSSQTVITPLHRSVVPSNVHPALHARDLEQLTVPHHVGCVQSRACRLSRKPSRLYSRAQYPTSLHHNLIG